jgi:hypothetical protein
MNKRYQVFISSTYADLKEERSKVIQTIMELDCIPAGMEIFPAIDDEQFDFIKTIIDDCDYYILIIGGRYGTLSEDGLSYTEKEYDYAIQKGIKIIAFIHANPDSIPLGKSEKDQNLRDKLEAFKKKVSTNRLIKFWSSPEELPGLVSLSLSKTIKTYPAIGWIRANMVGNVELLQELNEQRKENQLLKEKLEEFETQEVEEIKIENLAGLEDVIEIKGSYYSKYGTSSWAINRTWEELFSLISPYLLESPHDEKVEQLFGRALFNLTDLSGSSQKIDPQIFQTIKIHLKMLGLISVDYLKTIQGGKALFWTLTEKGQQLMYELRSVKKQ